MPSSALTPRLNEAAIKKTSVSADRYSLIAKCVLLNVANSEFKGEMFGLFQSNKVEAQIRSRLDSRKGIQRMDKTPFSRSVAC